MSLILVLSKQWVEIRLLSIWVHQPLQVVVIVHEQLYFISSRTSSSVLWRLWRKGEMRSNLMWGSASWDLILRSLLSLIMKKVRLQDCNQRSIKIRKRSWNRFFIQILWRERRRCWILIKYSKPCQQPVEAVSMCLLRLPTRLTKQQFQVKIESDLNTLYLKERMERSQQRRRVRLVDWDISHEEHRRNESIYSMNLYMELRNQLLIIQLSNHRGPSLILI